MAKKGASNRQRGFQAQIRFKKHKIQRKHEQQGAEETGSAGDREYVIFRWIKRRQVIRLADFSFKFVTAAAYALGGIQFHMDKSNPGSKRFVRGPFWHRVYHYLVTPLVLALLVHKLWVTTTRFMEQESPDTGTVMCMSLFVIQFVGLCMGMCLVFRSQEAMALFNTWEPFIALLDEEGDATPHDDIAATAQVIVCGSIALTCATANAIVSLLFPKLPVCFYPMCKAAGWIPNVDVPEFLWQLAFFPLELVVGSIAMSTASLGGMVLLGSIGVQRIYIKKLREMNPAEDRERMERRYIYLQLYHRAFCVWWDWSLPSSLFSLSASIVVCMFVTIRHTELPWYLYGVFPTVGPAILGQIFSFGYIVTRANQESDEVVDKLQLSLDGMVREGMVAERKKVLKRSLAFKALPFNVAGFADYTWAVPLAAWDEILNQLFFLLSL